MAVGKNKKLGKKKGSKKKTADPFTKKEWYVIRAPAIFPIKEIGRTIVTKTMGTRVARDSLLGRCFDVSLSDLKTDGEDEAFRKFRLRVEEVQGNHVLTQFAGMDLTTDKLRSLVRKWQTLIEAHADIRTTDGYSLRLFAIGFTKKRPNSTKKTAYAQTSQVKALRKKMIDIMTKEAANVDLNGLVDKLMSEIIGKEIDRQSQAIYPLTNVLIRKVKMLKTPKLDVNKLIEIHGGDEKLKEGVAQPVLGQKVEKEEAPAKGGKGKKGGKAAAKEEEEEEGESTEEAKTDKDAKADKGAKDKGGKKGKEKGDE
jgi:small subunit ribosomal protein S3Ae